MKIDLEIHKDCGGVINSIVYADGSYWKQCGKCLKLRVKENGETVISIKEVEL